MNFSLQTFAKFCDSNILTQIFFKLLFPYFATTLPELYVSMCSNRQNPGQRVHQAALVAVELREPTWILPGFWIVLDDVIDGAVEYHKPGGVTRDNLRQNPGSGRNLLIPAF